MKRRKSDFGMKTAMADQATLALRASDDLPFAEAISSSTVRRWAAELFPGSNLTSRLQRLRPRICPFEELIVRVPSASRVLDVGCGAGLFLGLLARSGKLESALGCDMSRAAITIAETMRKRLRADERDRLKFFWHDATQGLPDGTWPVVSLIDVAHHLPPSMQREVLDDLAARVTPGGMLIYKDIAPRPVWKAWANRLHDAIMARQFVHYLAPDLVTVWLESQGLILTHRAVYHRLWYAHTLLIFQRATRQRA